MVEAASVIDISAVDVPQLEALVAQFYGAGTQDQVRAGAADARRWPRYAAACTAPAGTPASCEASRARGCTRRGRGAALAAAPLAHPRARQHTNSQPPAPRRLPPPPAPMRSATMPRRR
jgi:hypothetical protein